MQKVKFLYNPSSGENAITKHLDTIINLYQNKGYTISLYRLNFAPNQKKILTEDLLSENYHHILIAGGDGTINYIVNILKLNNINTPIALLASGTANDFAINLGMPQDIISATRKILSGSEQAVDLGKVNGKYFVNVFSCGLLTEVSQKTPTLLKNTLGKLAYCASGVGELAKFKKLNVEIKTDVGNYSGTSLMFFVFNGQTAGSLKLAYLANSQDGLLDVLIVKGDNTFETIEAILGYLPNLWRKKYSSGIVHFQCKKLTAKSLTKEPTDMDGQKAPDFPINIECEQGAIKIILPRTRKNNK